MCTSCDKHTHSLTKKPNYTHTHTQSHLHVRIHSHCHKQQCTIFIHHHQLAIGTCTRIHTHTCIYIVYIHHYTDKEGYAPNIKELGMDLEMRLCKVYQSLTLSYKGNHPVPAQTTSMCRINKQNTEPLRYTALRARGCRDLFLSSIVSGQSTACWM